MNSSRESRVDSLMSEYAAARLGCGAAMGRLMVTVTDPGSLAAAVEAAARELRAAADRLAGAAHLLGIEGVGVVLRRAA